MPSQVTVHIKRPVIKCTPIGGTVHVQQHDDTVQWISHDGPFTLVVTDVDDKTNTPIWPFVGAQPHWPVTDTGALTLSYPKFPVYYKYTVQAELCESLDPIIIVDR